MITEIFVSGFSDLHRFRLFLPRLPLTVYRLLFTSQTWSFLKGKRVKLTKDSGIEFPK